MSRVHNVTVPYVALSDFDWSFARTGPLPWNQTVWSLIAVFTALPLWMTVELTVCVFYTFRRYSGLYFWSVLITTWGVTLHAIGFVFKDCVPSINWIFSTILAEVGWVSMVTGFSLVLYSRLHLVIRSQRVLRLVLALIVTDAFLFHVPTVVFQFGLSNKSSHKKYLPYMAPMERVQILGFSIQEILISTIYIYATLQMLKGSFNRKIQRTTAFLILIQVVVILCDVVVIALDYAQYFTLKAVIHSFVYAFKLQLEFVILNQFKDVIANGGLAPKGLQVLQADSSPSTPSDPPTPPNKLSDKKWWSSQSVISPTTVLAAPEFTPEEKGRSERRNGLAPYCSGAIDGQNPALRFWETDISFDQRSAERGQASQGLTQQHDNTEPIKKYVAGATDVLDIERQYLGAWNQGPGEAL